MLSGSGYRTRERNDGIKGSSRPSNHKWDGKEYNTMWVSPPYTKRGTKFVVADVKGTGENQLVVLSPYGTVQIWEMK